MTQSFHNTCARRTTPIRIYWPPKPKKWHGNNFGDILTPLVIERLFGFHCTWSPPDKCDIAGAGSIIEYLLWKKRNNRPILWGSGFITGGDNYISDEDFQLIAVRGNLTRQRIDKCPRTEIKMGDPGLLVDCLIEKIPSKKYALGIIPHYGDMNSSIVHRLRTERHAKIIDITSDPGIVMQEIAESECILSSSLHGLIAADSIGIPNAHLKISNKVLGGSYKFVDYYSVFDKPSRYSLFKPKEVTNKSVSSIIDVVLERFQRPTNIKRVRKDLIEAFPFA